MKGPIIYFPLYNTDRDYFRLIFSVVFYSTGKTTRSSSLSYLEIFL